MRRFTLPNGIRVLLWPWNSTSAAVTVGIQSGSRDDPPESLNGRITLHGLNHGLEHVVTRATRRLRTWEMLVDQTDGTCFYFNAMTDKRAILICAETSPQNVSPNLDALYEMVVHGLFTKDNVAFEKKRILNEAREDLDTPVVRVSDAIDRLMFANDGLAHPILGTERSIERFSVRALRNLHRRVAVGRRLVVVVTGNFKVEQTEAKIRKLFGAIRRGQPASQHRLNYRQLRGGIRLIRDDALNQFYVTIGVPVFGLNDPRRPAMSLLRNHFSHPQRGGSRMRRIISSVGVGYSATDFLWHWNDVGQYYIEMPVMPHQLEELLIKFRDEVARLRNELIPEDEFERSMTNTGIGARVKFANPLEAANFIAEYTMTAGKFVPLTTWLRRIKRVKPTDIRSVARDIFTHSRLCVVIHGPTAHLTKKKIRQLLHWR